MMTKLVRLCLLINFLCVYCFGRTPSCINVNQSSTEFINNIFHKYGAARRDDTIVLATSHFEKLIDNLGIGHVGNCGDDDRGCEESGSFDKADVPLDTTRLPSTRNKRNSRKRKRDVNKGSRLPKGHTNVCLKSKTILSLNNINKNDVITKDDFFRICPTLIQQIDKKICKPREDHDDHDDHEDHDDHDDHDDIGEHDEHDGHGHGQPNASEIWGYGFASITIISVLCLSVIAVIPCLKKSFYTKVMSFLVALAVGTLTGDALLHLIPHAFLEGINNAGEVEVDEPAEIAQHYSLVHRALFVLMGLYLFFIVEQVMTITKGNRHSHSHGGKDNEYGRTDSKKGLIKSDATDNYNNNINSDTTEENKDLDSQSSTIENGEPITMVTQYDKTPKDTKISISSVAWMVMVGDGFHNFSDGLAVGAAFSSSISSGLSTSIAIFCHELPHELGDFAILIKNGMSIKQALIYNVASAILAYLGLVVGILAGEDDFGRHLILSITAGLFLYVSLVDMLPELMLQGVPKGSRMSTFICQHMGLLTGVGIMLVISMYEHTM